MNSGDAEYHLYNDQWTHGNVGDLAFAEKVKDEMCKLEPIFIDLNEKYVVL